METVLPLMGREDFWLMHISLGQELGETLILTQMNHGLWEIPIMMVREDFSLNQINKLHEFSANRTISMLPCL